MMIEEPLVPLDVLAEHIITRMIASGDLRRRSVGKLSRETLLRVALALLDPSLTAEDVWRLHGKAVGRSAFHHFVRVFEAAAVRVHREMIGGTAGPYMVEPAVAARRMCVSLELVAELIDKGELPAVRVGNMTRLTPAAIREFILAHPLRRRRKGRFVK